MLRVSLILWAVLLLSHQQRVMGSDASTNEEYQQLLAIDDIQPKDFPNRKSYVWHNPCKIAALKTTLGYVPITTSNNRKLSFEWIDKNQKDTVHATFVPITVSDFSGKKILYTEGLCNCIGIAIWTPNQCHMLHCPPQEFYKCDGQFICQDGFAEFVGILKRIPPDEKVQAKVYMASCMFTDSFECITQHLQELGFKITGMAVKDLMIQHQFTADTNALTLNYYIDSPAKKEMRWDTFADLMLKFSARMAMDASNGDFSVEYYKGT